MSYIFEHCSECSKTDGHFSVLTLSLLRVTLIDFTLSTTRLFYSSMGDSTGVKGLIDISKFPLKNGLICFYCSAHGRQCALVNIQRALKSKIINGFLLDR